jgi:hypothetical protein
MSNASLVVTKGGLKYIMVGTLSSQLYLFSLPKFEMQAQLKVSQSVHVIHYIAPGYSLVAIKDKLLAIGIGKNSLDNHSESD